MVACAMRERSDANGASPVVEKASRRRVLTMI
jgi:hypothetical protein